MQYRKQIIKYLFSDLSTSVLSWILCYWYFSRPVEPLLLNFTRNADPVFFTGLIVMPIFWLFLYFFGGFYHDVFRYSRLRELGASLLVSLPGAMVIFIFLISKDIITHNSGSFFHSFMVIFLIHLSTFYIPRLVITSRNISAIRKGRTGYNTIIIGSDQKAVDIYKDISSQFISTGNRFIGFVSINGNSSNQLDVFLKHLGGLDKLTEIISTHKVNEVILAIESNEHSELAKIITGLDHPGLVIKAIPGLYDILTGKVRINSIIETPLIVISPRLIPVWQRNLKYGMDIFVSVIALILLLPVSLFIVIWIKMSSKGPVIYSHERIGKNGKPFRIYKFRSMISDAEKNGPELSSENDNRITGPGRFLRRTRLDEIPNFINVLKGDMSLVGPRPERRYFIDQIMEKAPYYNRLLKIKPGITSWGQIRYGYAENVDQMIQRLKYDILYLENMSVYVDFQILIRTLIVLFKRKGV